MPVTVPFLSVWNLTVEVWPGRLLLERVQDRLETAESSGPALESETDVKVR